MDRINEKMDAFSRTAIKYYGVNTQIAKCIEEMEELYIELTKLQEINLDENMFENDIDKSINDNIYGELADVLITVNTICNYVDKDKVIEEISKKINRQYDRICKTKIVINSMYGKFGGNNG